MSSWCNLPAEVLQNVFKLLVKARYTPEPKDLTDVYQCISVCKGWKKSGQIVYYSSFEFRTLDSLCRLIDTLEKYPHLGEYVKKITYEYLKISKKVLNRLAVTLPNLEYIQAKTNHTFYTGLIQLTDATRWNYLRSIPYPQRRKDIDLYIMAALEYRRSLTSIILADKLLDEEEVEEEEENEEEEEEENEKEEENGEEEEEEEDEKEGDEKEKNEEEENEEEEDSEEEEEEEEDLMDDNAYDDYYFDDDELEEDYTYTCDGIFGCECYGVCKNKPSVTKQPEIYKDQFKVLSESLNKFPLLQTLYIHDRHSDKGIEFYDEIIDRCKKLTSIEFEIRPVLVSKASTYPTEQINLEKIRRRKNIKKLVVEGSLLLSDNSLLYIMHKFPALEYIHLNRIEQMFRHEPSVSNKIMAAKENFSPTVIAAFLLYIQKIPTHHFGLFFTKADIELCMQKYIRGISGMMKPLTINVHFGNRGMNVADIEISNCSRLRPTVPGGDICIVLQNIRNQFPFPKIIEACGSRLKNLRVQMDVEIGKPSKANRNSNIYEMARGHFLDHIFLYCPNLTHLYLEDSKLVQCDPKMCINETITDLTMASVQFNCNVLSEISVRLPSLKVLKLQFCRFGDIDALTKYCNFFLFCFNMPNSSLDKFIVFGGILGTPNPTYKYNCLYVKVQTKENPARYFHVYCDKATKLSRTKELDETQYPTSYNLPNCAFYHFYFDSIKTLTIGDWSGAERLSFEMDLTENRENQLL